MPPRKTKSTTKVVAKNNPFRLTHIPLLSWVAFWACISATLVLISATFTSALSFAQTPKENADTVAALQQLGDALEKKADEMTGGTTEPEGRIMIGMGAALSCDTVLATSTADVITLSLSDADVRMNLPYSFSWGNEKYAMNPFDRSRGVAGEVYFGPGIVSGDCVVVRDSSLIVNTDTRSMSDIRRELNTQDIKPGALRERTINGIPVLSYTINRGAGDERNWIAFGRTNRYNLHSAGWLTDAEAVKIIQSLRVEK